METVWFVIIAFMLAAYVVLDGFDLGTGVLHLFLARNDSERRQLIRSVGPVWDGNEVWLIATGGALVLAFPTLYASSFSGFYLPLMMVLWLLILRAIALEMRGHMPDGLWPQIWDSVFALCSTLLCIFFGVAMGNVVRGVPLDETGHFFQALWAHAEREGRETGILDGYTLTVGATALTALSLHGALWIQLKTTGELRARATQAASRLWWAVLIMTTAVTSFSLSIQPQILANLRRSPWGLAFPLLALAGLFLIRLWLRRPRESLPFFASGAFLIGMMSSVVFGLYPYVLPATNDLARSLTVFNSAAGRHSLSVGLLWWIPGILLAVGYFWLLYRHHAGKVSPEM